MMIKNNRAQKKPVEGSKFFGWVGHPLAVFGLAVGLAVASCGTIKPVPVETHYETVTNYIDSLRIKDSIRVIPIERYVDIVPIPNVLHLETSLAEATAYYDSTFNALRGEIHNKREIEEHHTQIEHSTAKADTVKIEKEIPYEVEVIKEATPRWAWWSLVFNILGVLVACLLIYLKFRK